MIDEAYDCAYQGTRAELNGSVIRLFAKLARRFRPTLTLNTGETSCAPGPSPPSPSPRCR